MTRLYDKLVIVAFVAAAVVPFAAKRLKIHDHGLWGAVAPTPRPALTLAGVRDESFQAAYTAWFENHVGLKNYSIFLDNTLLYHALGDAKPGAPVMIGRHNVLFYGDDIAYYDAAARNMTPGRMEMLATRIAALQTRLAAEHRALVPVITPAKTSIYRDDVPTSMTVDPGAPRASDVMTYEAMKRALDAHHVVYADGRGLLATSHEPRDVLWATTARHWTQYGACLALAQVAQGYTKLVGRPLDIACELHRFRGPLGHDDFDLYRLLDAWWVGRPHDAIETAPQAPAPEPRPTTIFDGTSFCWGMLHVAQRSQQVEASVAYYNTTLYSGPNKTELHATPTSWRDAMLGKDLYVLDLFEGYLGSPGTYLDQFLDDFDAALAASPTRP